MCYDAPDPPDLTESVEASKEIAEAQRQMQTDQLAWAKEQDAMNRGTLNQVLGVQLPIMQETAANAREDRARYKDVYQPLENNLVSEFQNYDTAGRRQEERGRSIADVNKGFDAARRNALQRLESYGVDPSQTRNAALDLGTRVQQAAAQAGAATAADRATEQTGRALRAEAINIGKGLPSNVAASYGQSIQAGNAGIGNANQTTGASAGALTSGMGYGNTALQGYGQAANIQNQGFQNQMAQYNAQSSQATGALSAVGGIAGMAMMADGGEMYDSEPGPIDYGDGDGSGIDDQVPIMASKEEYIIPADVVRAKGVEFFDKLVERYHTPAEEQREDEHTQNIRSGKAMNPTPRANGGLPRYAIGGAVGMAPPTLQPITQQPPRPPQHNTLAPYGGNFGAFAAANSAAQQQRRQEAGPQTFAPRPMNPQRPTQPPVQQALPTPAPGVPGGPPPQQAIPAPAPGGGFGGGGFGVAPGGRGGGLFGPPQPGAQAGRPNMQQLIGRTVQARQQARPAPVLRGGGAQPPMQRYALN